MFYKVEKIPFVIFRVEILCLLFIIINCLLSPTHDELNNVLLKLEKYFASPNYDQRCALRIVGSSIDYFSKRKNLAIIDEKVNYISTSLINTPCLGHDSLGNGISNYIEARLCAHINGLHFLAPNLVDIIGKQVYSQLFKSYFDYVVINQSPISISKIKELDLTSTCPCSDSCHERKKALLQTRIPFVRSLLQPVFERHLNYMRAQNQSLARLAWKFKISSLVKSVDVDKLPRIPDVSIHYRCGDNVVRNYGFLPFRTYSDLISPMTTKTIYVMSESPYRKGNKKTQRMFQKCDVILTNLLEYLGRYFPSATILVLRGGSLFDDMTRLVYASQTFCSISTFCFWPALVSNSTVYFPATNLIASGHQFKYHSNFIWLDKKNYSSIMGTHVYRYSIDKVVSLLSSKY